MTAFRLYLAAIWIVLIVYTLVVGAEHGWNLLAVFFADMAAMGWAGQFNLDFMMFLSLFGLWLAWRHDFTPGGIALGVAGFFLGMSLLAPYVIYLTVRARGDMKRVLLGDRKAAAA